MVISLTSAASGVSTVLGQLVLVRLAFTVSANAVATPATWPYKLSSAGDINGSIPYFDSPAGWPKPILPGP